MVGDKANINIYSDPWLRYKDDFVVEDGSHTFDICHKVCSLFKPNTKE